MKYIFCLVFVVSNIVYVSSLICYYGISDSSIPFVTLDTSITGNRCNNDSCVCCSYKFVCSSGDTSCSTQEQQSQVQKSAWTVLARTTCLQMQLNLTSYMSVTCCSTNYCNNQNLNTAISIKPNFYFHLLCIIIILFCFFGLNIL